MKFRIADACFALNKSVGEPCARSLRLNPLDGSYIARSNEAIEPIPVLSALATR